MLPGASTRGRATPARPSCWPGAGWRCWPVHRLLWQLLLLVWCVGGLSRQLSAQPSGAIQGAQVVGAAGDADAAAWACPPLSAELVAQWAQDSFVIITVSDYLVYEHFGTNFIRNMQQLSITHVLYGVADERTAAAVHSQGMPCFAADTPKGGVQADKYHWGSPYWSRMTWLKVEMVQRVVQLGYNVIHTDADAAWWRDPIPYFSQHQQAADMLVSSDGLQSANPVGVEAPEPSNNPNTNFNTGVYMIRNTTGALALLQGWLGIRSVFDGNDQTGFYEFVRRDTSVQYRPQSFSVLNDTAWIGVLPVQLFMHSYTLFLMQLHKVLQVQPYEVHMVWGHSNREGKMHRMREALVSFDDPHYYEDQRLLLVDLELPKVPAGYNNWTDTEEMIAVHVRELRVQLHQLTQAFGLAMALNRTLVLPKMLCFCYKNWFGVPQCRIPGDSYTVYPITCPLSQVLDVERLYRGVRAGAYQLHFREHSFMENPRTPANVKQTKQWVVGGSPDCGFCTTKGEHHDKQPQLLVPRGLDDLQLQELLGPATQDMPVLHVASAGDLFRGFRDPAVQSQFFQAMRELEVKWCCRMPEESKRLGKQDWELLPLVPSKPPVL